MNLQKLFCCSKTLFILQNWRPPKIGGPRRLPSLPNGRTGPVGTKKKQKEHKRQCR